MRKDNVEMKNFLLDAYCEMAYTHTYAFAIREHGMLRAAIVEDARDILPMITYCERNAESHGGTWGVRVVNTKATFEIVKEYAEEVVDLCSIEHFEKLYAENRKAGKGNRGNIFEQLLVDVIGGYQVEKVNAKFTECGDIVVDGRHIQCKLYNATFTTESTIQSLRKARAEKA